MDGWCRGRGMGGIVEEEGMGGRVGTYAGGVGAVALIAEGAFADDFAVGIAGEGEGVLAVGFQGDKRRGEGSGGGSGKDCWF